MVHAQVEMLSIFGERKDLFGAFEGRADLWCLLKFPTCVIRNTNPSTLERSKAWAHQIGEHKHTDTRLGTRPFRRILKLTSWIRGSKPSTYGEKNTFSAPSEGGQTFRCIIKSICWARGTNLSAFGEIRTFSAPSEGGQTYGVCSS